MMRRVLVGVGVALGVSFPGVVLARLATVVLDGSPARAVLRGVCLVIVLSGPVAGGAVTSVARPARPIVLGGVVGALSLTLLGAFGVLLQGVRDGDAKPAILPALAVVGVLLGGIGGGLGTAWAGRTRP